MNVVRGSLYAITGILITAVLLSGCLDSPASYTAESSSRSSGSSCSSGYSRYDTSAGHCCRSGYPYYYDSTCHQCPEGYFQYDTSAGHCCPAGYSHYYGGKCHQCSEGYYQYDTSAGHCCPEGYPYFSDGKCHTQPAGSPVSYGTSPVTYDSRSGCPQQSNLQCSQWIAAGSCRIQSCTCYYSDRHGDTSLAFYHTSDGAYFRCSGAGRTLSCIAAAEAATRHCTQD